MPLFALADCNNFYASCERLFRPTLEGRPVVVLSNNDGCIIARSDEAKALGVPMGAPLFQWRDRLRRHGVEICSANFALYGDLSRRVMQVLGQFTPEMEIYSIDEAFLSLDGFRHLHLEAYARQIRRTVRQWTGIPVSIGIGPSKTLAKLANGVAKKDPRAEGVFDLRQPAMQRAVLPHVPVGDIWGVGRRLAPRLEAVGIHTAWDLRQAPAENLRRQFGITLVRTARELAGEACLQLETQPAPRQQILSSRAFGQRLRDKTPIAQAVSHHVRLAWEKLRAQHSLAGAVAVFLHTSPHGPEPWYGNQFTLELPTPDDDLAHLTRLARHALNRIYRPGHAYHKCGVMLLNLSDARLRQGDLFTTDTPARPVLQAVMEQINRRYGRGCARLAGEGFDQRGWGMQQQHRSPCWTTRWQDLPAVR